MSLAAKDMYSSNQSASIISNKRSCRSFCSRLDDDSRRSVPGACAFAAVACSPIVSEPACPCRKSPFRCRAYIAEIKARERGGLIELPRAPALRAGDPVRVLAGPFQGQLALYAGMKPRERVEVLLQLLGGQQRVTLARGDVDFVAIKSEEI